MKYTDLYRYTYEYLLHEVDYKYLETRYKTKKFGLFMPIGDILCEICFVQSLEAHMDMEDIFGSKEP